LKERYEFPVKTEEKKIEKMNHEINS
jgi:hypothetical protein